MKHFTLFLFGLSLGLFAQAQIVQSDFSEWVDGAPVGWNGSFTNLGNDFEQVDSDAGFGPYAVRLIYTGNTEPGHRRFTTQPLTTEDGVNYTITFRVRGTGDIRAGLYDNRQIPNTSGFVYSPYTTLNNSDWTEVTRSIVGAANNDDSQFIFSVRNTVADTHIEVDYVIITADEVSEVSIYDIQFTEDPSGTSPLVGQTVATGGIVSAVIPPGQNNGFFIQDASAAWHGIFVFTGLTDINVGDSVTFAANVVEFNNMTQLSSVALLDIVSSGNPVYAPVEISTADVNSEPYEGVLVRVTNALCTNPNSGFGQWVVNDGSGSCLINPAMHEANRSEGTSYNITGPVFYSFTEYKILPRNAADVEVFVSVAEQNALGRLSGYPNPVRESLQLTNAQGLPVSGFMRIVDLSGREVMQLQPGSYGNVVDLSGLPAGWYILTVVDHNNAVGTFRFIKE